MKNTQYFKIQSSHAKKSACTGQNKRSFSEALIERAHEGICVSHEIETYPYVRFTLWNNRMTEITGYTMDEINRLGWYQTVYPDVKIREKAVNRMRLMREGDDLIREDWDITAKNGELRNLRISTSVLISKDGLTHVQGIFEDRTEQVQAFKTLNDSRKNLEELTVKKNIETPNENSKLESENHLKNIERKYKKLFETKKTVHMVFDVESLMIDDVNPAALELFGYDRKTFLTLSVLELAAEKNNNNLQELLSDSESDGNITFYRLRKKDGVIFFAEISTAFFTSFGKKKCLCVVVDVSKRIERERNITDLQCKLICSGLELESVMRTSPDIIYRLDKNGKIIFISSAVKEYGYNPEELIGKDIMELVHPEDRHIANRRINERRTGDRRTVSLELRLLTNGKKAVPFEFKARKIQGCEIFAIEAEGVYKDYIQKKEFYDGTQGIARDISERRMLEEQLMNSRKKEAVATLAGGIAHQFNNALSAITGTCDLMQFDLKNLEGVHEYIFLLRETVERMQHLTSQLIGYAEEGKYRSKSIQPDIFLNETMSLLEHTIPCEIDVEINLDNDLPQIYIDPAQIQMVFSAVLANAVEAVSENGKIGISLSKEMFYTKNNKEFKNKDFQLSEYIRFTISDNGKGMDDETQKRLFEPFFSTKFLGRGMGMAAAYGIIKNHGGEILVDSEPGRGASVHIYIPVRKKA